MPWHHEEGAFRPPWMCGLLLLQLFTAQGAAPQRPRSDIEAPPSTSTTSKQRREWLQWNHRAVGRDVRRLVELAQETNELAPKLPRLAAPQRETIEALREKITVLSQEFEKTNPDILPFGVVRSAEAVEAEAKTLLASLGRTDEEARQFSRLRSLTRQIQERAKRVADRLGQP